MNVSPEGTDPRTQTPHPGTGLRCEMTGAAAEGSEHLAGRLRGRG